ncbi:peptidoglycan D,D-transpeptidase FtsI family protein [Brevibacterium litoralis]|uniref:peptidoglycan D,D-transpeptidase FtsI family protein n=1 Tax=Brevibacterium litoralis TaxID=3138935 RepID=UPI0032EC9354
MATKKKAGRGADPRARMWFLVVGCLVVMVVIAARLVAIQGMDQMQLAQQALASRLVTKTLPAERGTITAADGTVLADNAARYRLVVDQQNIDLYEDEDGEPLGAWGAAEAIAPILETDPGLVFEKLDGDRRWNPVAEGLTAEVWGEIRALGIPGLTTEEYSIRTYPAGAVGGNLLGFVSTDGEALAGLELKYDDVLQGVDGEQQYERGARGDYIPLGDSNITPAVDGQGLRTTIDPTIQYYAQQAIGDAVAEHEAEWGSVVIREPDTGRVLAVAEAPSVDPNDYGSSEIEDMGARSFTHLFEPGSTAKMITAAALIEEGLVTPETEFTVPYEWTAPNDEVFKDSHSHPDQKLTFAGIMAESSNTGTILAGDELSLEQRHDYLSDFGFGQRSAVDFPGGTGGILHPVEDWDGRTKYTVMFGQGVAATAIQTAEAFSVIANDGVAVPTQLVSGTVGSSGAVTPVDPGEGTRVVSADTAAQVSAMLEGVVAEGTGGPAAVPGYRVAGKTGTSQAPSDSGGYDGYTSSFVGYAPAEDPEVVVSVTLQRPRKGYYGGTSAAPVFSDVTGFTLRHLGVPPSTTTPDLPAREWE